MAKDVFARLNQVADWSVWQDAPDLTTMVTRALRYKIQLQLEYRDEMAFGLALYGASDLPEAVRPQLLALFDSEVKLASVDLIGPVLARLPLRPGVSPAVVQALIRGMITTVTDQARPFFRRASECPRRGPRLAGFGCSAVSGGAGTRISGGITRSGGPGKGCATGQISAH